jgi:hypothetical protein
VEELPCAGTVNRCAALVATGAAWGLVLWLPSCGARTGAAPVDSAPVASTIVAACVRLASCDRLGNISDCIFSSTPDGRIPNLLQQRTIFASCVDAAGANCQAVFQCQNAAAGPCPVGGFRAHCDGSRQVYCSGGELFVDDCASGAQAGVAPGSTCVLGSDGQPECGIGACPSPAPAPKCDGEIFEECVNGVLMRRECSLGVCALDPQGSYDCDGTGAQCQTDECDGDVLLKCLGGRQIPVPCNESAVPSTCGYEGSTAQCAPSPSLACDPVSHVDRCDGTSVVYCDGEEREIDCVSLGFSGCGSVTGGAACK